MSNLRIRNGIFPMRPVRLLLAFACGLSISCKASDTFPKNESVQCPASIIKGGTFPSSSILIGVLPVTRKNLLSAALITKSGSNLMDQVWDEETLDFEETSAGMIAEQELDTSRTDPYLKCSYPGVIDPAKKQYYDVQLLLPIHPKARGKCRFMNSGSEVSAVCEYLP
jgi:hypothetical protein